MEDPIVVLRLAGAPGIEQFDAWTQALGLVVASRRVLVLDHATAEESDMRSQCARVGVDLAFGPESVGADADVVVLGSDHSWPTPLSLRRLVAATHETHTPHRARSVGLPGSGGGVDGLVGCVAVPVAVLPAGTAARSTAEVVAECEASGFAVASLPAAAVLATGRPHRPAERRDTPPPHGHPAALAATTLHQVMAEAGIPAPALPLDEEPRPFLTVITRTQGRRMLCLEEVLSCLAAQTSRDFEVVLACHRAGAEGLRAVRTTVGLVPQWLRERVRVVEVDRPGRSAPLNDALDLARGRYAAVLDDDDVVSTDWVAIFQEAESRGPGTVLRAAAIAQDVHPEVTDPEVGPAAVEASPARAVWPMTFSMVDHLHDNASPVMSVAYPRGFFAHLGRRFDESLEMNEDWAYLVEAAGLVGVTSDERITSVYRIWTRDEGSRDLHQEEEWAAARSRVEAELDRQVLLLPPGSAADIRRLHIEIEAERAEKFRFAGLNEQAAVDLAAVNEAVVALRARIAQLEERIERQRRRRRSAE